MSTTMNKNVDEKFCCECGCVIKEKAELCNRCGCRQPRLERPTAVSAWAEDKPRPWRRYFARMMDTAVNGLIMWFHLALIAGYLGYAHEFNTFLAVVDTNKFTDIIATILLVIPLNACLIGLTGGTLGKWLFGITLNDTNGEPMGFGAAFYREILVVFKGMGLGIPIVALITGNSAYRTLKKHGSTTWDQKLNVEVRYRPNGIKQVVGAIFGFSLWLLALATPAAIQNFQRMQLAGSLSSLPRASVQFVNEHQVKVEGPFGLGTAAELRRVLDVSPNVHVVELESNVGGLVDEGMAVFDIIHARHMSTYTQYTCVSACTIAYFGGARRFLADNATLQFHQWEINGIRADRETEMARRMLVTSGVPEDFAARAFASHQLWAPDHATLIAAGVVTHSMDGKSYR